MGFHTRLRVAECTSLQLGYREPIDLNADDCDGSDKRVNIENIIDLNSDGSDEVNIENFIDINFNSGSDEGVNIERPSQTKNFDLNSDGGDDSDNTISGSLLRLFYRQPWDLWRQKGLLE
ncbi:hypothetical protein LguiA_034339 [Lonicera macranthoides]